LLTTLVVAGRLGLDPWWGRQHNRHLVFLPTVILVAWVLGFGPGLLVAGLCTAALGWFWMDSGHGVLATVDLCLFLAVSAAICVLVQSMHGARARADSARRSRERLLAVVAHDLRNPLAAVRMTSTLLRKNTADNEGAQRQLTIIDRAVSRMDDLIRDLVDA